VDGWPSVLVNLEVGFTPPANPNATFAPNFKTYRALLDTGSSHTIIDHSLANGLTPLRPISGLNMGVAQNGGAFNALLEIQGLNDLIQLEVGTQSIIGRGMQNPVIIGRDVLARYRLVYDPPKGIVTLERSV
jgi:predicted aspartyl protease